MVKNAKLDINIDIKKVKSKVKSAVGSKLKAFTTNSAADAVTLAPKDTGHHSRNIFAESDEGNMKFQIHTESGYGGYLEVGTVKMTARPHIVPAAQKNVPKLKQDLKGCV